MRRDNIISGMKVNIFSSMVSHTINQLVLDNIIIVLIMTMKNIREENGVIGVGLMFMEI